MIKTSFELDCDFMNGFELSVKVDGDVAVVVVVVVVVDDVEETDGASKAEFSWKKLKFS